MAKAVSNGCSLLSAATALSPYSTHTNEKSRSTAGADGCLQSGSENWNRNRSGSHKDKRLRAAKALIPSSNYKKFYFSLVYTDGSTTHKASEWPQDMYLVGLSSPFKRLGRKTDSRTSNSW